MHVAYGFYFYDYLPVYKQIYALGMFVVLAEHISLVYNGACHLTLYVMPSSRQLPGKSRFVCLLL